MSVLAFFMVTQAGALAAIASRRAPALSLAAGLVGLLVGVLAALAIVPGEQLAVGGTTLTATAYLRLFLAFGTVAASLVCLVALATTWQRDMPAASLLVLGWTGLALALPATPAAVLAGLCAGLAGILVTLVAPASTRGVDVSVRELRAVVVAGALAIGGLVVVAVPAVGGASGTDAATATLVGLAYVAVVVALALRFGVIPFHVWAGRLSQAAPEAALPLLLAWAPAGFGLVALAWVQGAVVPTGSSLGIERAVAVAIGATTLILGTFAVWIQDDLEHVVGYSTVQDAGFVVLGLAVLGPEAWGPARTWVLVFGVAKTALAAWALALERTEGGRRVDELAGWARRSPTLGLALAGIALATIGWPGSPAWEARAALLQLSVSEPLRWLVSLGAFSSLAYYARLGWVGVRPGAGGWAPALPSLQSSRAGDLRRRLVDLYARATAAVSRLIRSGGHPSATGVREGWRRNRGRVARGIAVALTLVAVAAAAGWAGIPEAAAEGALPGPAALGGRGPEADAIAAISGAAPARAPARALRIERAPDQASGASAQRSMSRR